MITEVTRDEALIAAANGKPAFVITKSAGYPDIVNLTRLLGEALTEKDNIFIADLDPPKPKPLKVPEPEKPEKPKLAKVKDKAEFIRDDSRSSGRPSTVDDGKVKALYNAGWSKVQIASEFGVTQETIGNHIEKLKEKGEIK